LEVLVVERIHIFISQELMELSFRVMLAVLEMDNRLVY
jgi:hypothetical protein